MSNFLDDMALYENNIINEKYYRIPELLDFTSENLDIQFDADKKQSYLFYVENPAQETIGYREDLRAFFIKATPCLEDYYQDNNIIDGDTLYFDLESIVDQNTAFQIGTRQYSSFKNFLKANGQNILIMRLLGINTPELPHYQEVAVPTAQLSDYVKTVAYSEVQKYLGTYVVESINHQPADLLDFFVTPENYCEIVNSYHKDNDETLTYFKIIYKNEALSYKEAYLEEGEACQKMLIDLLRQASDIRLVIDQQTLNRKPSDFSSPYDVVDWLTPEGFLNKTFVLLESLWQYAFGYTQYTYKSYNAPGQDSYGRSLGAVYVKTYVPELQAQAWVNVAKYLLYHYDTYTEAIPAYSSNPNEAYHNNFFSPTFKLSTYDKRYTEILDGFTHVTSALIEERDEWYEAVTGLSIDYIKEYSVILGDCILTVPPMSIRSSTETDHLKIPLLRSKGSLIKSLPRSQKIIELDIYFNGDEGINGSPKEFIGKNGELQTYYMNGLRSLIAMFKLTPFLPIENNYINQSLLVDAVTLVNLNVTTVPNYPKCLKATVTLAEFNYSIFMPELTESEYHNTFAQSIHYPAMRWYYQRLLQAGETIKNLDFNSEAYIEASYGAHTALVPMTFTDSRATFYIPDRSQLETRLEIMNDTKPILTQEKLTEEMEVGAKALKDLMNNVIKLGSDSGLQQALQDFFSVDYYNDFDTTVSASATPTSPAQSYTHNLPLYPLIMAGDSDQAGASAVLRKMPIRYTTQEGLKTVSYEYLNQNNLLDYTTRALNALSEQFNRLLGLYGTINLSYRTDIENKLLYIGGIVPLPTELTQSSYELKVIAQKVCTFLGLDSSEANDVLKYTSNGRMGVNIEIQFNIEDMHCTSAESGAPFYQLAGYNFAGALPKYNLNSSGLGLRVIDYLYSLVSEETDSGLGDALDKTLIEEKQDIVLNQAMGLKFVKYDASDLLIEQIALNYGNTFSNMTLNMVDGKAFQYCGAQDLQIQLTLITNSDWTLNALTHLPELSAEYARTYHKVLNCWPLRLDCELSKLFGVLEVLIENVQTETIANQPGLTRITLTLTAVDRTVRQREALSRIDTASNAGSISLGNRGKLDIKTYFNLNDSLVKAELYPDLELPTVDELLEAGFEIYRDKNVDTSKPQRVYADPDFYFIYGQALACEIFRNNFLKAFEDSTQEYDLTDGEGAYTQFLLKKTNSEGLADLKVTTQNSLAEAQRSFYQEMNQNLYNYKDYSAEVYNHLDDKAKCTLKLSQSLAELGTAFWDISTDAKLPFKESTADLMPQTVISTYETEKEKLIRYIDQFLAVPIEENGIKSHLIAADASKTTSKQIKEFKKLVTNTLDEMHNQHNVLRQLIFASKEELFLDENTADAGNLMYEEIKQKMLGILLAYADTFSGETYYNNQTLVIGDDAASKQNTNWQARTYMNSDEDHPIPYCKTHNNRGALYATSFEDALNNGYMFGPFGITLYSAQQINELHTQLTLKKDSAYFLDPYYLKLQLAGQKQDILAHKEKLLTCPGYGAIACFRQMLFLYKFYIEKGKLFSLYEMARQEAFNDWKINKGALNEKQVIKTVNKDRKAIKKEQQDVIDSFLEVLSALSLKHYDSTAERKAIAYEVMGFKEEEKNQIALAIVDVQGSLQEMARRSVDTMLKKYKKLYEDNKDNAKTSAETLARYKKLYEVCANADNVDPIEFAQDIMEMVQLFEAENSFSQDIATQTFTQIAKDEKKMFIARYIAMACSLLDSQTIHPLLMAKDTDALNNLIVTVTQPNITSENTVLRKFIYALNGRDVIDITNVGDIPLTLEAKYRTYIAERINVERSKNPRLYLKDSFLDMIRYDKRGRMLRAFPTYYMFFVDEGREIGLWKLHDNFYSSTAIAEIEVTKSRKIAADTAHITLSNLFNSYTQDDKDFVYDLDNPIYNAGLKYKIHDAFNALFSPRAYFQQEEKERLNTPTPLTARLTPGTRLHIRMGYGANATELPIVFNGQIAEISNGEVCEIVAQGDGVELLNPIQGYTDSSDVQYDDQFVLKKFFSKWLTNGATPKTILSSLLTTDGTWIQDKIQKLSKGYIKTGNPFGIYHFGDMKFDEIFKGSECIQNLFEANARSLYETTDKYDLNIGLESNYQTEGAPKIAIDINGKTVWDIMHICASTAPDYKTAVVPFELRSSLFYGTGRDYYAYGYGKEQATEENSSYIYEKRKPFEQYHFYTSYSDIIANQITADATQVRTNAVGIYNETRSFGNIKTKETSRLYIDFDIYTEYQKAMTVDTQLWAQGMPILGNGFGLWLNADTDDDVDDLIPGAAEIAWRMTASALKNNMKDMYQGELIVMGDPSVKPHDRMLITDIYEEMEGAAWVEAVVHSFNAQTGFTTSLYADCINEIDDRYEQQNHFLSKNACATAAVAYFTPVALNQLLFRKNLKYVTNVLTSMVMKSGLGAAEFLETHRIGLTNLFGILKITNVDKAQTDILKSAIKTANALEPFSFSGVGSALKNTTGLRHKIAAAAKSILTKETTALSTALLTPFETLNANLFNIAKVKNVTELIRLLERNASSLEQVTGSNVLNTLNTLADSGSDLKDLAQNLNAYDDALGSAIQSTFKWGDEFKSALDDVAKLVLNSDMDDEIKAAATLLQNYKEGSTAINSAAQLKTFTTALKDCTDVCKDTDLLKRLAASADDIKDFSQIVDTAKDVYTYAPDLKNAVTAAGALTGPAGIVATVLWIAVEMAVSAIIGAYASEYVERYLQNLQVMRIYPLSKNGKVLTAGITGHKGLVVGSATENMQGAWTEFITNLFGAKEPDNFVSGVIQFLFTSDKAKEIASHYRVSNHLTDVLDSSSYDLGALQAKFDENYNARVSKMAHTNELLNLNLNRYDQINQSAAYFKDYMAISYDNGNGLSETTRKEFTPIKSYLPLKNHIQQGLLILYHDLNPDKKMTVPFNDTAVELNGYYEDDEKLNLPILRRDALMILNKLIGYYIEAAQLTTGLLENATKLEDNQLQITSATIVDSQTYDGTGLVFRVISQNTKALETACFNLVREINDNQFMVNHFEQGDEQIIAVALPIAATESEE